MRKYYNLILSLLKTERSRGRERESVRERQRERKGGWKEGR